MLKFCETDLLLSDPQGDLVAWLDRYYSLDDLRIFGVFEQGPGWTWLMDSDVLRQTGMPIVNWPAPPKIKLNTLYTPVTGASRWGFGLFLVTKDILDSLKEKSGGSSEGTLEFDDGGETSYSATLYMLPPRLVSPKSDICQELYIVPLVDIRYFWQWRNFGDGSAVASWTELINHLSTQLDMDIEVTGTIQTDYTWREDLANLQQNENAANVLDSVAACLGRRVVFASDTAYLMDVTTAAEEVVKNNPLLTEKLVGFDTSDISSYEFNLLPENVEVYFPKTVGGVNHGTFYHLTATFPGDVDLTFTQTGTTATLVNYLVADCDTAEATPNNEAALQNAANTMAEDYYHWRLKQYDISFSGLKSWYVSGFDDSLVWHFAFQNTVTKEYACYTRVCSLPINFDHWEALPEFAQGGTTTGSTFIRAMLLDNLLANGGPVRARVYNETTNTPTESVESVYDGCLSSGSYCAGTKVWAEKCEDDKYRVRGSDCTVSMSTP